MGLTPTQLLVLTSGDNCVGKPAPSHPSLSPLSPQPSAPTLGTQVGLQSLSPCSTMVCRSPLITAHCPRQGWCLRPLVLGMYVNPKLHTDSACKCYQMLTMCIYKNLTNHGPSEIQIKQIHPRKKGFTLQIDVVTFVI